MERKTVLDADIEKVLISAEELDALTDKIAAEIDRDYRNSGKRLLLLCILKGSVVFMGDLMKKLTIPVEIDFMKVSSYGAGTETTGRIKILLDLHRQDLSELDIVIVEDIIDSGRTRYHSRCFPRTSCEECRRNAHPAHTSCKACSQ